MRQFVVVWLTESQVRTQLTEWMFFFVLCVVQVAASATGWSHFQHNSTGCVSVSVCMSVYDPDTSKRGGLASILAVAPKKKRSGIKLGNIL
jgi:hypothetical protein